MSIALFEIFYLSLVALWSSSLKLLICWLKKDQYSEYWLFVYTPNFIAIVGCYTCIDIHFRESNFWKHDWRSRLLFTWSVVGRFFFTRESWLYFFMCESWLETIRSFHVHVSEFLYSNVTRKFKAELSCSAY